MGFNNAKLLSSTCSTVNISLAMVDSSLPKLMHKHFKDDLCIHISVDGYLWSGFNSAELSTVATLIAPYGGIWQVGLKKTDNNIWSRDLVGRISLNTILSFMVIF